MRILAVIQARMNSTRLPQKIMTPLCGKPMLWHIVNRVNRSGLIHQVVIATSLKPEDDIVESFANENNFFIWRGSQDNVLERFYDCATFYKADILVRLTADNALVDAGIIDAGITYFQKHTYDYVYYREGLPIGMACEIFTYDALKRAYENASDAECLEHVTPYLYKNPHLFHVERVGCIGENLGFLRWTMDTESDKELITQIYNCIYTRKNNFTYRGILEEYKIHPGWTQLNSSVEQVAVTYRGESTL